MYNELEHSSEFLEMHQNGIFNFTSQECVYSPKMTIFQLQFSDENYLKIDNEDNLKFLSRYCIVDDKNDAHVVSGWLSVPFFSGVLV